MRIDAVYVEYLEFGSSCYLRYDGVHTIMNIYDTRRLERGKS